jgi:peptidyl-prolyl cis-trans isomerase SurA
MQIFPVLISTLFLFILTLAPSLNCQAELVDRIVAVVNDEVITSSEVNDEGKMFFQKIIDQAPADEVALALRQAREDVLNSLIDKKLIAQEAVKQKLTVSDEEIKAAVKQMSDNNNMTVEEFQAQVRNTGMTDAVYHDNLRNQILQSKLLNYEVRSKIIISDDEILDYYDTHYTKRVEQGGYYLLQMGFIGKKDPENPEGIDPASKLEAKKRAERVHALAESGQDFSQLAKKFSELPSATDGGNIGTFQKEEMADYMKTALLSIKPGQITQVVETPEGYQFFKLLSSQEGGVVLQAPYDSVKEEIKKILYDEKLKTEFEAWVGKIRTSAYIKKM